MASIEPQIKISNPLRPFEKVAVKKVCPKCGSLFVTKKECESCGFQFWVDLLGEPFGVRSFFTIRDDFTHQYAWSYRFAAFKWGKDRDHIRKYRRALNKRFEILCGYFFDNFDADKERRRLFLFEASEIMNEYNLVGGQLSDLWLLMEKGENHPLFPQLAQRMHQLSEAPKESLNLKELLIHKRLMGTFSYFFLMKIAVGFGAVILAAFFYMKAYLQP